MLVFITLIVSLTSISADEVYGNYRPPLPILGQIFGFSNNRGDVPIYDYAKKYQGVMNNVKLSGSVLNQGLVFTDAVQRRIDTADYNQYANQWSNGQNPWMRRYPNNQNSQNNNYDGKQAVNRGNQGNVQGTQIDTQFVDVTRTSNEHQITTNRRKQDQSTEDPQNNSNTKPKLLHEYITNYNKHTTSHTDKTPDNDNVNDKMVPDDNKRKINTHKDDRPNVNVKYGTKTTQDNEVTPKTKDKKAGPAGDRWVWSSEEGVEATTVLTTMDLEDRSAFDVKTCPVPKIKVGDRCIIPD